MRKRIMLVVSAILLIAVVSMSLVACSGATDNTEQYLSDMVNSTNWRIEGGTADKKISYAYDNGDNYIKEGKIETYVIVDGEFVDIYTGTDIGDEKEKDVTWAYERKPIAESPKSAMEMYFGTDDIDKVLQDISTDYGDFDSKFNDVLTDGLTDKEIAALDGYLWVSIATPVKSVKYSGGVLFEKNSFGEVKFSDYYNMIVPEKALDLKK